MSARVWALVAAFIVSGLTMEDKCGTLGVVVVDAWWDGVWGWGLVCNTKPSLPLQHNRHHHHTPSKAIPPV